MWRILLYFIDILAKMRNTYYYLKSDAILIEMYHNECNPSIILLPIYMTQLFLEASYPSFIVFARVVRVILIASPNRTSSQNLLLYLRNRIVSKGSENIDHRCTVKRLFATDQIFPTSSTEPTMKTTFMYSIYADSFSCHLASFSAKPKLLNLSCSLKP